MIEPQQCPLCGCNYYYTLPAGQVTGCQHPWHFSPHPAAPQDERIEQPIHARVYEYDGAFRCLDCHKSWGALPGHPVEPPVCVPSLEPGSKQERIEQLRAVINPLIEFGDHLEYCRTKAVVHTSGECDCGRDQAVADAKKFIGELDK